MKNLAIALLFAALACGLAAAQPAPGQTGMDTKKAMKSEKKPVKKAKTTTWKGTVQAVDAAAMTLTVKDHKGMTMTMPITAGTKILKAGKTAALSEITAGEMVQVTYEGEMASPAVKSVKVEKAGTMKKEKTQKKTMPADMKK